jgi:hypothetical protein
MRKVEAIISPVHVIAVRLELERLGSWSVLTLSEVRYSDGDQPLVPAENRGTKYSRNE